MINENIHTVIYNIVFATHCYVLEREKNLTNALWFALQYLILCDSRYTWLALDIFSVQYHSIDSLDMDIFCHLIKYKKKEEIYNGQS